MSTPRNIASSKIHNLPRAATANPRPEVPAGSPPTRKDFTVYTIQSLTDGAQRHVANTLSDIIRIVRRELETNPLQAFVLTRDTPPQYARHIDAGDIPADLDFADWYELREETIRVAAGCASTIGAIEYQHTA